MIDWYLFPLEVEYLLKTFIYLSEDNGLGLYKI